MFKLLTENQNKKVRKEYFARRTIVIFFAFIVMLVVSLVGMLPSYLLTNTRQIEAEERYRIIEETGYIESEAISQAWLDDLKLKLRTLAPNLDKDRPSHFVDMVLESQVTGVRIIGISLEHNENKLNIMVEGVAATRQALVSFRESLEESSVFAGVTLPISDLAKDSNIEFQIELSISVNQPTS